MTQILMDSGGNVCYFIYQNAHGMLPASGDIDSDFGIKGQGEVDVRPYHIYVAPSLQYEACHLSSCDLLSARRICGNYFHV